MPETRNLCAQRLLKPGQRLGAEKISAALDDQGIRYENSCFNSGQFAFPVVKSRGLN